MLPAVMGMLPTAVTAGDFSISSLGMIVGWLPYGRRNVNDGVGTLDLKDELRAGQCLDKDLHAADSLLRANAEPNTSCLLWKCGAFGRA